MRTRQTLALLVVLVAGLAASGAAAARQARGAAAQFVGTWRLVSIVGSANDALGSQPTGVIYYDTTGHMAVQIMTSKPRPTWTGTPTPEQAKETLSGYTAYFGTYIVDEQAHTVTHRRQGTLTPGAVDFVRKYEFSGDRLVLTPVDSTTHLTWERLK